MRGHQHHETMSITIESITKAQRSILLYVETCCVDHGGLLEGIRMNADDHAALAELEAAGILKSGRIPGRLLGTFQRQVTHWCDLSESGWLLAHQLRRACADRPRPAREKIDAVLAERASVAA